jgi:hypothetical protein
MAEREHIITSERLQELDALYEQREDMGIMGLRPTQWNALVDALRAIRRMVEAGITVKIAGTTTELHTWEEFYGWAHGRYHMLEDGADRWIGHDVD